MNQTITTGFRTFTIYHFTGKVAAVTKNLETQVTSHGGEGYISKDSGYIEPVRIQTQTIVHDQFFLVDKAGKERSLQLENFNVACREGNIVTASWAIQTGGESGPYFAITNHSTGDQFIKDEAIKDIVLWGTNSKLRGCLVSIAALALIIYLCVKNHTLIAVFGIAAALFYLVVIPIWATKFKKSVEYPQVELW